MNTVKTPASALKLLEISLLLGLAVFLLTGALALGRQSALAERVVRLHVLANSDTEEDQTLKLQVRDRVLERAAQLLEASADREEAEELLHRSLPELRRIAEAEIARQGYDYAVTAELTDTAFPTRAYDGFSLPAGTYLALRIVIGQGAGQNWWCVVFPPLCTAAVSDVPETALAAGLGEEQVELITETEGDYVLKFKSIELWESLRQKWETRGMPQ